MSKVKPWSNTVNPVRKVVDKLYNELHVPEPEPEPVKKKLYKRQFYGYIRYTLAGDLVDVIRATEEYLALHHPDWRKNSLNAVSNHIGKYAGCSCYGYFWRRQIKEDDAVPEILDDDLLEEYKRKTNSLVGRANGVRTTFKAFLRYDLDGKYVDTIPNTIEALTEVNKSYVRGSIYAASRTNGNMDGVPKTLYGYFWRRLVDEDDPVPKQLDIKFFK